MQIQKLLSLTLLCTASTLASCGSVLRREIEVRAINREGTDVKAMVVVGNEWPSASTKMEDLDYTTCKVPVVFDAKNVPARIRVKPLFVDPETGMIQDPCPRELAPEPYKSQGRDILYTDPGVVLFILEETDAGF